jgi:hypothetical protein
MAIAVELTEKTSVTAETPHRTISSANQRAGPERH